MFSTWQYSAADSCVQGLTDRCWLFWPRPWNDWPWNIWKDVTSAAGNDPSPSIVIRRLVVYAIKQARNRHFDCKQSVVCLRRQQQKLALMRHVVFRLTLASQYQNDIPSCIIWLKREMMQLAVTTPGCVPCANLQSNCHRPNALPVVHPQCQSTERWGFQEQSTRE